MPDLDVPGISYHFKWYPAVILTMAPIAFVTMTEHMGHIMVLNSLTKRNFFKNPGLHRTMMVTVFQQLLLVLSVVLRLLLTVKISVF